MKLDNSEPNFNTSYIMDDDNYNNDTYDFSPNSTYSENNYVNDIYYWKMITTVLLSLQLIIGLPSNLISLTIWTKGKECKNIACSMYFRLITLSDALSILNCFSLLIQEKIHFDLEMCHLLFFLRIFLPSLSTWLTSCLSFERYLSLKYPFSFRPTGARIRALIAFVVLILILTGLNSHAFLLSPRSGYCTLDENFRDHHDILYEIASLWTLCVIPFVLINLTNILILFLLYQMKRQRLGQNRRTDRVTSFTKIAIISCTLQSLSITPLMMLSLNSFDYLDITWEVVYALNKITMNTVYINNCFNFVIYYCNSSIFRSDFKELCCCGNTAQSRTSRTCTRTTDV